jgi:hypothetical protein
VRGGHDGDLGRPVGVDDRDVGAGVEDLPHRGGGQRLAAGPHLAQRPERLGRLGGDQPEQAGGEQGGGDPVFCQGAADGGDVQLAGRADDEGVAVQQRNPHLVRGGVEGVRRLEQHPFLGAVREPAVGGEVADAAVGDGDALGPAGRAGGVHDVGDAVGAGRHRHAALGQRVTVGQVALLQDQPDAAVAEDVVAPGLGPAVVDGHVHGTRADHAEDGEHVLGGAVHGDADGFLVAHAVLVAQPGGDALHAVGEFGVGQRQAAADQRLPVGGLGGAPREQFRQGVRRAGGGARAPLVQQPGPLGGVQDVDLARAGLRVGDERLQDRGQPAAESLDAGPVEGVGAVGEPQFELRAGDDHEGERIVRAVGGEDPGDGQPAGEGERLRVDGEVLQHGEGVEQVAVPGRPLDLRQSQELVGHQPALLVLEPPAQGEQCLAPLDPDPHRHGVEEQADHGVHAGDLRRAAREGHAEGDVGAVGQPAQQQAPRGLHHAVQGESELAHAPRQPVGGLGRQPDADLAGQHRGGPVVGHRGQHRRPVEAVERAAPGGHGGAPILLGEPRQVVAVRRHGGQRRRVTARRVQLEQLAHQDRRRPAVQQDVVVGHQQPVPGGPGAYDGEPQQGRPAHVEAGGAVAFGDLGERRVPLLLGQTGQVDLPPGQFDGGRDELQGARAVVAEPGAQVAVPVQQGAGGGVQGGHVERAVDVHAELHDVDVRAVLLVVLGVEQQSFLQGGERQHGFQRRGLGAHRLNAPIRGELVQLVLRDQGDVPLAAGCRIRPAGVVGDLGGRRRDAPHGAVREHVLRGEAQPRGAGLADQLDGDDAVAALLEEVVVRADPGEPEHLGEDPGDGLLLGCGGLQL